MISICIPTYESPKFMERCLDSIAGQASVEYEVIISDDSRSNSIRELVGKYKLPIRYFHNEKSLGSPENWNQAIKHAKGEFVHLLHQDDYFLTPYSLLHMRDAIEDGDILFTPCKWHSAKSGEMIIRGITKDTYHAIRSGDLAELFVCNYLSVPSVMMFRNGLNFSYDTSFIYLVDVDFYISSIIATSPQKIFSSDIPLIGVNIESSSQVTNSLVTDDIRRKEWVAFFEKWQDTLSVRFNLSSKTLLKKALSRENLL